MVTAPNPLQDVLPGEMDWRSAVRESALLVVDMQYYDASPDHGLCQALLAMGMTETYEYYTQQLRRIVPNINTLLQAFRRARRPIFYAVIESATREGHDRCLRHKRIGLHIPPGSVEGQILADLAPEEGEVVLRKTTASVFNSTPIDRILRNMGVAALTVCGVVTNGCVESTVRDAADLSYDTVLVEDACAALSPELHESALRTLRHSYCTPVPTEQVVSALR